MGRTRENEKLCGRKRLCTSTVRKSRRLAMKKGNPLRESKLICEPFEDENVNNDVENPTSIDNNTSPLIPDNMDLDMESKKDRINSKKTLFCSESELIEGRRLFDIQHLFSQILNGERHGPFDCSFVDMEIISENKSGLYSEYTLQCQMCRLQKIIKSEEKSHSKLDVNSSIVLGSISAGLGYSQINEIAASLNMPFMMLNTFNNYHEKVADIVRESAWKSMEEAAAEEAKIAISEGDVDVNGIPCITVVTDGAWAKRSYNINYDASSGVVD